MNKQLRPGKKKNRKEKRQVEVSGAQAATRQGGKNRDRARKGRPRNPERGQRQTKKKQEGKVMAEPELHQGAGAARRQLSRHNWIRDNSVPAVRGCDSHKE